VYAHDPDRGVILLEDLGDELLETAVAAAGADRVAGLYRDAVDLLLEMRRVTKGMDSGCCAFGLAFDEEKLLWEMDFFMEHFVRGLCSLDPLPSALADLNAFFRLICSRLAALPRIFTHRDYHSRNLLLDRDRLVMIDFQDARMGPAQYDLASLLYDSYVELPEDLIEELVTHYVETAGEDSAEHFRSLFYVMALQRNIKALGTFGYQTAVRKTGGYLSAIPRTAGYIARNMARCPDLAAFAPVIRDYVCGPAVERTRDRIP
jgi:aminoglycoside/choline kinase family phosphotransferase